MKSITLESARVSRLGMISGRASPFLGLCLSAVVALPASASLVRVPNDCNVSDVQISSITKQDGSATNLLGPGDTRTASACLGAYAGNDEVNGLGQNLGYRDDGFLNDTTLFPDHGAFLSESDLLDLETPGELVDPGWIFVNKTNFDDNSVESGTIFGEGGATFTFDEGILSVTRDPGESSGTFTYKPPQTNPESLLNILGADKFFDQAAVVFKAGNSFAIYNFTLSSLGLPPVLGTEDENFEFSGTWDVSNTLLSGNNNGAGLSHVSLWLRDPTFETTEVPAPATLLLFGSGLILSTLVLRRRRTV